MRSSRAVLSAFVLSLVAVLAGANPAGAGGPTSVLLVATSGATSSLYYNDADYQALADQLGAFGEAPSGSAGQRDHMNGGQAVTVTWLIHDVTVWRVDYVHLDARGGPWIRTIQSLDGSSRLWDDPGVWHRAADPTALTALLTRLGLVGGAPAAPDTATAPFAPAAQAPAAPAGTGPASQAADDQPASTRAAAWGLGGVLAGVLLTLAAVGLRARRRSRADEVPDEELDVQLAEPGEAEEWRTTVAEELVSTSRR